jgi:hypothetical protein
MASKIMQVVFRNVCQMYTCKTIGLLVSLSFRPYLSYRILKTRILDDSETDTVSIPMCFLVFRIPDSGQVPETAILIVIHNRYNRFDSKFRGLLFPCKPGLFPPFSHNRIFCCWTLKSMTLIIVITKDSVSRQRFNKYTFIASLH